MHRGGQVGGGGVGIAIIANHEEPGVGRTPCVNRKDDGILLWIRDVLRFATVREGTRTLLDGHDRRRDG